VSQSFYSSLMDWTPAWAWTTASLQPIEIQLGDLFAYGCAAFPDRIALADRRETYDFRSLEDLACRFAARLRDDYGVRSGDLVMILARKSCLVPPLAAAIWKLGAVYMPVDAEAPVERLAAIASSARPCIILAIGPAPAFETAVPVVSVTELMATSDACGEVVSFQHRPEDIAYVIHTSGSTGKPKGVAISVGALRHYFSAHNAMLRYGPSSRVFSLTPFHFDVSIEDTLLPLSLGAYVYLFNRPMTGATMRKALIEHKTTHLIAVSTLLTLMSDTPQQISRATLPYLEMVMTGAEVCAPGVINLWKANLPDARVFNVYGPTEVTIVCTGYEIERPEPGRTDPFPIGRPLEGLSALLLDPSGREIQSTFEPGELCLGGPQVMVGYLGDPEETAKRVFLRDGVRFYRSGDTCFRDETGNYHFVGRDDGEVKIAGRRIHLGEIQSECLAVRGVERAAVGIIERNGVKLIAAVISATDSNALYAARERVTRRLPAYMQPSAWGLVSTAILHSSGKTDDKSLVRRLDERYLPGASAFTIL
jgi:D-alanine--poly(phosphoribitol) ligase subunit 1